MNESTRPVHPILVVVAALLCVGLSPASVVAASAQFEVEAVGSGVRAHTDLVYVAPPAPITFAPAGDSNTAWIQILDGSPIATTWPTYVQSEGDLLMVPGYAAGGHSSAQIAANTPNCHCDVVVVMVGTNDMGTERWATPMGERAESLVQIVVASGAAHALILAVPPRDDVGSWVDEWNAEQQRLAAFYGWSFMDPWGFLRTPENNFVAGAAVDFVHPTPESQRVAAEAIRGAILDLVAR